MQERRRDKTISFSRKTVSDVIMLVMREIERTQIKNKRDLLILEKMKKKKALIYSHTKERKRY